MVDFEADTPTPKAENVKWSDPPALTDITPPEVVFDLSPTQNSLNFSVNFTITDPIVDTVSPSGVSSYVFQWQVQGDLIWQQDEPIIATTSSSTMPVVRDFTGEDGKTYNFQVKATDVAGNISDWLPAVPTTTQVIILPPPPVIKPILINRIQVAPIEQRFVELYNPNIQDVDLTGWYLQRKTAMASSWSSFVSSTNFEDKTILANGHFLISRELPNSDILLNITLSDNNSLVLKDSGRNIIDEVGYGSVSDFETSPAQNPAEFEILSRTAGMDTDNNSLDFSIINTTSPSNS